MVRRFGKFGKRRCVFGQVSTASSGTSCRTSTNRDILISSVAAALAGIITMFAQLAAGVGLLGSAGGLW